MDKKTCYFNIQSLEEMQGNGLLPTGPPERVSCFEFFWFKSGAGSMTIDLENYPIEDNLIYCVAPGQYRYCRPEGNVGGYYLCFSADFLYLGAAHSRGVDWLDSFSAGKRAPMITVDADLQHETAGIMRKMIKECANYYLMRSEVLSGLLNILIIDFSRAMPVTEGDGLSSKEAEMVRRFTSLVKDQCKRIKLVADYAAVLCVTPSHLNRTVKKITGHTASYYIQQQIILEAKQKAMHSNGSMKEIAYFLGFDDLAYFSKFFKKNTGMNFTSFKKKTTELS